MICFNRYMVECEYFFITFIVAEKTVLIDTWWNVNTVCRTHIEHLKEVLIDTWWNVNKTDDMKKNSSDYCFNRYMVECEFASKFTFKRIPVKF